MRLIQPTLLLLLVAIHCESSCPKLRGPSKWEKILKECIDRKCEDEIGICLDEKNPNRCFGHFHCINDRCSSTGKVDTCIQKAKVECIKNMDLKCPGEETKGFKVLVNRQELVKEFGENGWWAVATADHFQNGFLNDPCSKFTWSVECDENGQLLVYLELSTCHGNSQTGECWTADYKTYYGIGKQRGNSGIIDLTLTKEDFLVPTNRNDTNKLTVYVHEFEEGGAFAMVSVCGQTDTGTLLQSGFIIISLERTYESLRRNSDNATLTKLDQSVSKFGGQTYGMNNAKCTN